MARVKPKVGFLCTILYNYSQIRAATEDELFAREIAQEVTNRIESGFEKQKCYFYDRDSIPGRSHFDTLDEVTDNSKCFIVLMTSDSGNAWNKFVQRSIHMELILQEEPERFIPVQMANGHECRTFNAFDKVWFGEDWRNDTKAWDKLFRAISVFAGVPSQPTDKPSNSSTTCLVADADSLPFDEVIRGNNLTSSVGILDNKVALAEGACSRKNVGYDQNATGTAGVSTNRGRMNKDDELKITKNLVNIKDNLEPSDILDHMRQRQIFDDDDAERVKAEKTRRDRVDVFCYLLVRRGPGAFPAFIQALKETRYFSLLRQILDTKVDALDQNTDRFCGTDKTIKNMASYNHSPSTDCRIEDRETGVENEWVENRTAHEDIPIQSLSTLLDVPQSEDTDLPDGPRSTEVVSGVVLEHQQEQLSPTIPETTQTICSYPNLTDIVPKRSGEGSLLSADLLRDKPDEHLNVSPSARFQTDQVKNQQPIGCGLNRNPSLSCDTDVVEDTDRGQPDALTPYLQSVTSDQNTSKSSSINTHYVPPSSKYSDQQKSSSATGNEQSSRAPSRWSSLSEDPDVEYGEHPCAVQENMSCNGQLTINRHSAMTISHADEETDDTDPKHPVSLDTDSAYGSVVENALPQSRHHEETEDLANEGSQTHAKCACADRVDISSSIPKCNTEVTESHALISAQEFSQSTNLLYPGQNKIVHSKTEKKEMDTNSHRSITQSKGKKITGNILEDQNSIKTEYEEADKVCDNTSSIGTSSTSSSRHDMKIIEETDGKLYDIAPVPVDEIIEQGYEGATNSVGAHNSMTTESQKEDEDCGSNGTSTSGQDMNVVGNMKGQNHDSVLGTMEETLDTCESATNGEDGQKSTSAAELGDEDSESNRNNGRPSSEQNENVNGQGHMTTSVPTEEIHQRSFSPRQLSAFFKVLTNPEQIFF